MVLLPRLAQLTGAVNSHAKRHALETRALRHVVILNLLAAIAIAFLLAFVPILYGSAFGQTTVLGLILVPGTFALGLASPLSSSLVGRGHNDCARRVAFVVTPITLALYVVIIPIMHATGAALASTLSYTLTLALWARFYCRYVDSDLARAMTPSAGELDDYRKLTLATARAFARRVRTKRGLSGHNRR
jgi:O-antigen/teichoic acid export membrane protein